MEVFMTPSYMNQINNVRSEFAYVFFSILWHWKTTLTAIFEDCYTVNIRFKNMLIQHNLFVHIDGKCQWFVFSFPINVENTFLVCLQFYYVKVTQAYPSGAAIHRIPSFKSDLQLVYLAKLFRIFDFLFM